MTDEYTNFVRRKFTITEVLDEVLQELARRHYQGNVSLCLRTAIESHRDTVEGEGQFSAVQVRRQLDQLERSVGEVQAGLDDIASEAVSTTAGVEAKPRMWGIQMSEGMVAIVGVMEAAEIPLRVDDLREETGLDPPRIRTELSRLVDQGLAVETTDSQFRYGLAGQADSERSRGDEFDQ